MTRTLVRIVTPAWSLEIVGPVKPLPAFLPPTLAEFVLAGIAEAEVEIFDRAHNRMLPAMPGSQVPPVLFENTDYDFYLEATDPATRLSMPASGTLRRRHTTHEHHTLNFRNEVGLTNLLVVGPASATITLEVFPTKIDYRRDYLLMRDEVDEIARGLALAAQSRTYGRVGAGPKTTYTLVSWLALIRRYFEELVAAAEAIARNPHSRLQQNTRSVAPDRARRVDENQLRRALRQRSAAGPKLPGTGHTLPRQLPATNARVSTDTPENRLVKFQLRQTLRHVQELLRPLETADEDAEPNAEQQFLAAVRPEAEAMRRRLARLLLAPYLRNVTDARPTSSASMVFHQHPHYAAFARLYRLLNGGLTFNGEALSVGVKQIAQLYEYWCFLTIVRLLAARFNVETHDLVRIHNNRLTLVLEKGKKAAVRFRCPVSKRKVELVYNRLFNRLPTVNQQPDNVIQLAGEETMYVLDAKYRLAFDADYQKIYGGPGPPADDINVMHRYRDAIVLPPVPGQTEYRRPVNGAYVLFPYANEAAYLTHRFYTSITAVGIGAYPLLPGATNLLQARLDAILLAQGFDLSIDETSTVLAPGPVVP